MNKLTGNSINVSIEDNSSTKEKLMPHINNLIAQQDYVLAVDKVHTLLVHILKEKIEGFLTQPRNSFEYLLKTYIENNDLSEIAKIKLENDINLAKIFNNARNNRSFVHDNEGNYISNEDAKILCDNFIQTINLI